MHLNLSPGVLWNDRERGQDANMDCDRHLRVDRHRQKAFELGSFFVRNTASAGPEYVWNNTDNIAARQITGQAWISTRY